MSIDPAELTIRAKNLGSLIQQARLAASKSVEECAQAIGITVETLSAYELGNAAISLPELEAISFYLEVPLEYFWDRDTLPAGVRQKKQISMEQLIRLRHRMVGGLLRQARMEAKLSLATLSERTGIEASRLEAYELGAEPIPLPQLEALTGTLNRSIREFQDRQGPVGNWNAQQRAIKDFLAMPEDMQTFVSRPVNRPYLDLAVRLSEMSVDRLRAVAEGLLEITY